MKDILIGGGILLLLLLPFVLIGLLIAMVRKRKKREALGISEKIDLSYANLVDPFSWQENWLTCTLLFVLTIIFLCEGLITFDFGGKPLAPSYSGLPALGGVSHNAVLISGEWYRLFTAPFLHGGIFHLLFNGIALFFAGRILEKRLGRPWFFAIYFIGGLGGSLCSIAINGGSILSVGASGAIVGLFVTIMVVSLHLTTKSQRHAMRMFSLRILIPALLPHASQSGLHTDYAGHFGGAIGGGIAAIIMLMNWPAASPLPRLRNMALGVSAIGVFVTLLSFIMVAKHYPVTLGNYSQLCMNGMRDVAQKSGVDPTKYIKDNADYLDSCVKYYIDHEPR